MLTSQRKIKYHQIKNEIDFVLKNQFSFKLNENLIALPEMSSAIGNKSPRFQQFGIIINSIL